MYVIVDGQGCELARLGAIEEATYQARHLDAAVAVLTSDGGAILAFVARARAKSDPKVAERAAHRWRQQQR